MKLNTQKSDNELLHEINAKLSELIAVIGISGKERDSQVRYLTEMGFSNSEISRLVGLPKGTVDGIRASFGKKKKKA